MEARGQDADDVEVKNTIFSMPPMIAPGIDGLHGIFFPSQWELVGPSMCKLVKQICFAGKVPASTLIVYHKRIFPRLATWTIPYPYISLVD